MTYRSWRDPSLMFKMEIKEIRCYQCLKCKTIYENKKDSYACDCNNKCSDDLKGFHAWFYLYSFRGMAFYKCEKCGVELIGRTDLCKKKDPLDEIFVDKHKDKTPSL